MQTFHEDGIYFGLDEDEYHADTALGSTDLRHLMISGSDYWWRSPRNPMRDRSETPAVTNGHALHNRVLFGEDVFNARYLRAIEKADHPDALVTADDIKKALASVGASTTGVKDALISRLQNVSSRFKIWDVMVAEQEATGKTILKPAEYDRIVVSAAMIIRNPNLAACFTNGAPEVSIFWTQDGIRFKARLDYLRMNSIIDLKSFTNVMRKPVDNAIRADFFNKRLDIQATHYMNARGRARQLILDGRIFGDADREWLAKIAVQDVFTFVFVFYSVTGAPLARGWRYDPGTEMDATAAAEIQTAIDTYRRYRDHFGEEMWVDQEPLYTLTDSDVPAWMGR